MYSKLCNWKTESITLYLYFKDSKTPDETVNILFTKQRSPSHISVPFIQKDMTLVLHRSGKMLINKMLISRNDSIYNRVIYYENCLFNQQFSALTFHPMITFLCHATNLASNTNSRNGKYPGAIFHTCNQGSLKHEV